MRRRWGVRFRFGWWPCSCWPPPTVRCHSARSSMRLCAIRIQCESRSTTFPSVCSCFSRSGAPPYPPPPSATAMPRPTAQPASQPGPSPGPSVPQHFHDPNAYISNRALPTNLATLGVYAAVVLLSDLMLLYRLLVMYRYRFIWAVLPGLLTIASFGMYSISIECTTFLIMVQLCR